MKFIIYTDGSCRKNGDKDAVGAWGYVVMTEHGDSPIETKAYRVQGTTNQQMELAAAINGCNSIFGQLLPIDEIDVYTDSAYLCNCYEQGWYKKWQMNGWTNIKKQPVANRDLWEQLIPFFEDPRFRFHKVKGHADNKWNNYVDELVQKASAEVLPW